ncbi:Uncharacterized protein TCM_039154 [Theobroma cacao]|uniref:Uncharacterized protein n=1 Tax=Theobroma cacao TaxID=3641 RepID=A0A061GQQ4_THECC|nr:Uncharacterized protein TCM_039154 [Theobroma cacao]
MRESMVSMNEKSQVNACLTSKEVDIGGTLVQFDVKEKPKIFLGDCRAVEAMTIDGVSDDEVEDMIKEIEPCAARTTSIVRQKINKGRVEGLDTRTDQPLYSSDYPIPTTVPVLLYRGFFI